MIATTLPSTGRSMRPDAYPGPETCRVSCIVRVAGRDPPRIATPRHGGAEPDLRRSWTPRRRGNYDSGEDFVLEYGELRFTFNERDFAERCEQAALQARLRRRPARRPGARGPREPRRQRRDPGAGVRAWASTSTTAGPSSSGPRDRSLVHWLRRLVFRSAWLDQRVKEGELDVRFDPTSTDLRLRPARPRRRARRARARALLGPGRLHAAQRASAAARSALAARACGDRLGARRRRRAAPARSVPLATQVERREAAGRGQRRVQRDDRRLAADRLRRRGDDRQRAAVDDRARRGQRAARGARRRRRRASRSARRRGRRARRCAWRCRRTRSIAWRLGVRRRGEVGDGDRLERAVGASTSATSSGRAPASTTLTLEAVLRRRARRPAGAAPRSCPRGARR